MSVTIKLKRGNASDWTSQNITLASGEPGYELDTGRLKIGDGLTAWSGLPYSYIIPSGFVAGSGINLDLTNNSGTLTISASGAANIINYGDNRVLTSDGTTTGIDAETNLTFDGSLLSVSGNLIAISGTYNQVVFNTSLANTDLSQGQLQWNNSEGTLDLGFTDTYSQHMGEELHYRVRNNTASTLVKGTAVYASGLTPGGNNRIEIAPFTADGSVREVRFMGLVTEDISNGVNGYTTQFGYIRGIDTRGDASSNGYIGKLWDAGEPSWSEGDILYAHPTVAGKLTKVEPKHSISVAIILNRHQNQGKIFVRPTSYGHLDDNHDVNVSGATNGQFLQYNSSTDYWVPSSSGNFTTLLVNGTGVSVNGHTHTTSDITDFNSSVSGLLPTISNNADNRVLTSTGTTTGINAESNLTFNGSILTVTGLANVDNLRLDGNTLSSTNSNGNIIIAPNGTGPVQFSSTGNTRGAYAVDLQRRQSTSQVASGNYSFIGGGRDNTASATYSVIGGGFENRSRALYSTVSGGFSNDASANYSTVGGGRQNISSTTPCICSINFSIVYGWYSMCITQ